MLREPNLGLCLKQLRAWADCGPHFRAYKFFWNLSTICKDMAFEQVCLHFLAEQHGKGRNHGQCGLQRYWVSSYAAEHVKLDPPLRGPDCQVVDFLWKWKAATAKAVDNRETKLHTKSTYCLMLRPNPHQECGADILDFILSSPRMWS